MNSVFQSERARISAVCVALTALTWAAMHPVLGATFLNFDDDVYVYQNPDVAGGLVAESVTAAFAKPVSAHWHPLTMLSYMLDFELWGPRAWGFHLTNLLLHTANTLILFALLWKLGGGLWPAAFAAALFAVHPLHVEPVAWVSSRKDVLSAFFWLLMIGTYAAYVLRDKWAWFGACVVLFGLGLLSKSILVTAPFLLLLLDYWPLRRFDVPNIFQKENRPLVFRVLAEKLVLIPIGLLVLLVNGRMQGLSGQINASGDSRLADRIVNAVNAYLSYIDDTLWPLGLAPYYPLPSDGYGFTITLAAAAVVAGFSVAALWEMRRAPHFFVGWFWFLGTLTPVIGVIQLGAQARADRYMYFPMIGLFIVIAWGAGALIQARPAWTRPLAIAGAGIVIALANFSYAQASLWLSPERLYRHTLDVTGDNYLIEYNLAHFLESEGRSDEAVDHYRNALEIHPMHAASHSNLGAIFARRGEVGEALRHFEEALVLDPDNVEILCNAVAAYADLGMAAEARRHAAHAAALAPGHPRVEQALGWVDEAERKRGEGR